MAVNGTEIEVGQSWRTRDGNIATIVEPEHISARFPIGATNSVGGFVTYTRDGDYSTEGESCHDLIELILAAPTTPTPRMPTVKASATEPTARRVEQSALAVQVGGTHYKDFAIQPVEYIHANKLGFCEGNVVKYITRHAAKNGADDIRKVIHYCQLLLELQYGVKKEGA